MSVKLSSEKDMAWKKMFWEGSYFKLLSMEQDGTTTVLLKMDQGARIPLHTHPCTEALYNIRGEIMFPDNKRVGAGDFALIPAGVEHGNGTIVEEVVSLVRFSGYPVSVLKDGAIRMLTREGEVISGEVK